MFDELKLKIFFFANFHCAIHCLEPYGTEMVRWGTTALAILRMCLLDLASAARSHLIIGIR